MDLISEAIRDVEQTNPALNQSHYNSTPVTRQKELDVAPTTQLSYDVEKSADDTRPLFCIKDIWENISHMINDNYE